MPSIINATTSTGLVSTADNSGSLQLATNNGTTALTIDTSQNVGIGTSSPQARLHVSDAVAGGQLLVTTNETNSTSKIGSLATMHYTNSQAPVLAISVEGAVSDNIVQVGGGPGEFNASTQVRFFTAANNTTTGGTERMRITSSGFLFVNTTSLIGDGYVSVSFNGSSNVGMGLKSTHNGSFDVMRFVNYNNVQQGYINCNNSGSTTYNSGSDYRFKDNVQPMTDGLSKVMQLKPVTFNWKGDNSAGQGFIAHELAEIVPDIVSGEKDAVTEDGTIKPQGVDYGKLTAVLTSAIQELKAQLDESNLILTSVKAELDATKAEVQALKGVA